MINENLKRKISFKFYLILNFSAIAALGTMTYAFRSVDFINTYNHFLFLFIGGTIAISSLLSNTALGTYSLINTQIKQNLINPFLLLLMCFTSAIPYGFISYFGYKNHISLFINLFLSFVVVIVNAGIAYSGIYNFLKDYFLKQKNISKKIKFIHKLGLIIGFLVSTTIYVVTVHGISNLLKVVTGSNSSSIFYVACVFGIFSWIPFMALYSNSTKIVSAKIYTFLSKDFKKLNSVNKISFILLLISLGSGASFAQISMDFFDKTKDIPLFFKHEYIQFLIYKFIIPCSFFSCSAVNYLALERLFEYVYLGRGKSN